MKSAKLFVGAGLALAAGAVALGASITANAASSEDSSGGSALTMAITGNGSDVVMCSVEVPDFQQLPSGDVHIVAATAIAAGGVPDDAVLSADVSGTVPNFSELPEGAVVVQSGTIEMAGGSVIDGELPALAVGGIGAPPPVAISVDSTGKVTSSDPNLVVREGSAEECATMAAAIPAPPTSDATGKQP